MGQPLTQPGSAGGAPQAPFRNQDTVGATRAPGYCPASRQAWTLNLAQGAGPQGCGQRSPRPGPEHQESREAKGQPGAEGVRAGRGGSEPHWAPGTGRTSQLPEMPTLSLCSQTLRPWVPPWGDLVLGPAPLQGPPHRGALAPWTLRLRWLVLTMRLAAMHHTSPPGIMGGPEVEQGRPTSLGVTEPG